jgi:ribosome-associated protein
MNLPLSKEQIETIHSECKLSTSRSGGPGGQHVNKVETKVTLKWNVDKSLAISDNNKERIRNKLKNNINTEGELVLQEQSSRTQISNKEKVFKKLTKLLQEALKKEKKRKKTKPTQASKVKNKQSKKRRSEVKSKRKKPRIDF